MNQSDFSSTANKDRAHSGISYVPFDSGDSDLDSYECVADLDSYECAASCSNWANKITRNKYSNGLYHNIPFLSINLVNILCTNI